MNDNDDNPLDDAPSGAAAPLNSEATPTVILGGAGPGDGVATEIVNTSPVQPAAAQPAAVPAAEFASTAASPTVAAAVQSPFPAGSGNGGGGGPFESAAAEGGSDSMMTTLMALALVGMLLIIFLLWFKRCDTADVDRLLDVGATPFTSMSNLFGGR